jgi:tight adherence protein B
MRFARAAVFAVLAASLAGWCGVAFAAEGVKATPLRAKPPQRSFVVSLPHAVAVRPGMVTVTENGELVTGVAVTPIGGATGGDFGAVLLIDASESMKGAALEAAVHAARAFAERRKPNQKLSIVTYNDMAHVLLPFTTDGEQIRTALATTPRVAYWTRMYDAIEEVVSLIREEKVYHSAIVLLSDGQELGSRTTLEAATSAARDSGVRIFTVALMSRFFDSTTLKSLASHTGGQYYEANSPNALVAIYRKLGTQLANEYLVQYKSLPAPGTKVHVQIAVKGVTGVGTATYRAPKLLTGPPPALERSILDKVIQSWLTMVLVVLIIAGLLALTLAVLIRPHSTSFRKRIGAFVAVAITKDGKRQTAQLSEKLLEGTERSLRRTQWWGRFKDDLEIAEISVPAEQVIVLTALGTLLLAWIVSILFSTALALCAAAVPLLVRALIRHRVERQRRAFGEQLPDNLQVLASALRAGHSLIGALSVVVDDAPEPSRREFRRIIADEQLGVPLEEGITTVAERMKNRDLDQVALVAALQRETGGNSAEVLDRVADTVRERAALRRLVRTLTAQGRMARWIVSALPVALVLIISVLNTAYMSPLYHKTAGQILLVVAGLMVFSGSLAIKKIVNIRI